MKRSRLVAALLLAAGGLLTWAWLGREHEQTREAAVWWKQGRCRECHERLEPRHQVALEPEASSPPRYHSEHGWRLSHGRHPAAQETRCLSCHQTQECRSCHDTPPSSHTADFLCPRGDTPGVQRHTLLARSRPSACMTCHGSFTTDCTACHTAQELEPVSQQAREQLEKWIQLRAPRP